MSKVLQDSGQHLYNKNKSIKAKSYNKFLKSIIVIKIIFVCVLLINVLVIELLKSYAVVKNIIRVKLTLCKNYSPCKSDAVYK